MLKKNNLILFLLLAVFFASLSWSFFVPLWHFPDEQAHWAHVQYLAEGGRPPLGKNNDLAEEILISEQILRVKRDGWGNNSFTYNPQFNIAYSDNLTGLREEEIINLPKETRNNFIKKEAATYNDLFYQISSFIYKIVYRQNLFTRVFAIRIFWLFCLAGTVWLAYLITQEVFPRKKFLAMTVAVMVGFQPMFMFVSSGITIDNLINFLYTALFFLSLKIFKKQNLLALIIFLLTFLLLLNTKNNSLISLSIFLPVIIYFLIKKKQFLPILLLIAVIAYLLSEPIRTFINLFASGQLPFFDHNQDNVLADYSLNQHFVWTLNHTYREVLPWFWGVFRWLSLTLPRWVNRIMMSLLLISGIGLIYNLVLVFKNKKIKKNWQILFIIYVFLIYFLALLVWDWSFFRAHNYSFGIQGRYYFPVIVPAMLLFAWGMERISKYLLVFLGSWFMVVNTIAFWRLVSSYYSVSSFSGFLTQASQYKPWFAKGDYLAGLLIIYYFSLIFFWFKYIKFFLKNGQK